jgi:hypothetical protein
MKMNAIFGPQDHRHSQKPGDKILRNRKLYCIVGASSGLRDFIERVAPPAIPYLTGRFDSGKLCRSYRSSCSARLVMVHINRLGNHRVNSCSFESLSQQINVE